MFQRLQSRDQIEGVGMGLAFVKKIVENEGGYVSVASKIGVGSEFKFVWPKRVQRK